MLRCSLGSKAPKPGAPAKLMRLERIVANRGVGSRKEVSQLFRAGRVLVNGKAVLSGADKYPMDTEVEIEGYGTVSSVPLLALYHKPTGIVSTMRDDWGRASLEELSLEFPFLKSMHPVGRLDADTSGLLLFSSDGALTQALLHPSSGIPREYRALVVGDVDPPKLTEVLRAGVRTTEGVFSAELLNCRPTPELVPLVDVLPPPPADFPNRAPGVRPTTTSILQGKNSGQGGTVRSAAGGTRGKRDAAASSNSLGSGDDEDEADRVAVDPAFIVTNDSGQQAVRTSEVVLSVTEGKYRMVRRVLHNAGHSVLRLHRVRYGAVDLSDLEEGEVRAVSPEEKAWAEALRSRRPGGA